MRLRLPRWPGIGGRVRQWPCRRYRGRHPRRRPPGLNVPADCHRAVATRHEVHRADACFGYPRTPASGPVSACLGSAPQRYRVLPTIALTTTMKLRRGGGGHDPLKPMIWTPTDGRHRPLSLRHQSASTWVGAASDHASEVVAREINEISAIGHRPQKVKISAGWDQFVCSADELDVLWAARPVNHGDFVSESGNRSPPHCASQRRLLKTGNIGLLIERSNGLEPIAAAMTGLPDAASSIETLASNAIHIGVQGLSINCHNRASTNSWFGLKGEHGSTQTGIRVQSHNVAGWTVCWRAEMAGTGPVITSVTAQRKRLTRSRSS